MADAPQRPSRLASIDALRGFDMLWICGGRAVVEAAAALTGWRALEVASRQMRHVEWDGFTFWDLIFPLFLFLAGVSFPFSLASRRARGDSEGRIRAHVLRRGLVLVALGVLYNVGPSFDLSDLRYASVLGRIGLAWMLAALIAVRWGWRGQLGWIAAILLGYWALLTLVPVPGQGAPSLEPGRTLADWLDRTLLPGRLHRGVRDPEGILSTLPAVATGLAGMLAGRAMKAPLVPGRRLAGLVLVGLAALALGGLWDRAFPINKNLWSSSFVLWTAGWSLLLLALFHATVDLGGLRRLAFPLVVFGANALTAYLLWRFLDFTAAARAVLGEAEGPGLRLATALFALGLEWLVLLGLYRRRWFLRV
jgi:predicted acyltransferase